LDHQTRAQVINCLIEACSIRQLVEVGDVCANYKVQVLRDLRAQQVQVDELWLWNLLQR